MNARRLDESFNVPTLKDLKSWQCIPSNISFIFHLEVSTVTLMNSNINRLG